MVLGSVGELFANILYAFHDKLDRDGQAVEPILLVCWCCKPSSADLVR